MSSSFDRFVAGDYRAVGIDLRAPTVRPFVNLLSARQVRDAAAVFLSNDPIAIWVDLGVSSVDVNLPTNRFEIDARTGETHKKIRILFFNLNHVS